MKKHAEIRKLFARYLSGRCTKDEEIYLFECLSYSENEDLAKGLIFSELEKDDDPQAEPSQMSRDKLLELFQKIKRRKPGSK